MSTDDGDRTSPSPPTAVVRDESVNRLPVLLAGIGASAGGFEAVMALLRALPGDPGLSLAVIIHLAADHSSSMAGLLSRAAQIPVLEAADGMTIERNHVYVIPPNAEMRVVNAELQLRPRPTGRGLFKPIDAFFVSLAERQESEAIGVVLSGADSDGKRGLQEIKRLGGITFAQDETAKVPEMPESSIATGAVDFVLPPEAIAHELVRFSRRHGARASRRAEPEPATRDIARQQLTDAQFAEILELLRVTTGLDLSEYKQGTVRRRILRRMGLHRIHEFEEFLELLRASPAVLESLQRDVLVHVTAFFRDPEAFDVLRTEVIPGFVERVRLQRDEPLRIWVPGCATGEEVYSIAICLLESLGEESDSAIIQIFGTDISETAIMKARAGAYTSDIRAELTSEQLRRFFVETDGGFRVRKSVRDLCLFAVHDLTRDAPFSRIDLISCRNVLIYMSVALQKRVIPLLHYGLNPRGFLLLGATESIRTFSDFLTVDKRWSLYARAEVATRSVTRLPSERASAAIAGLDAVRSRGMLAMDPEKEAARFLLGAYAPPAVVINDHMDVLYFLGRTGPFLELPLGKASHNLLALTPNGLRAAVSRAVRSSLESNAPSEQRLRLEGDGRELEIRVVPLGTQRPAQPRHRLVIFTEAQRAPQPALSIASTSQESVGEAQAAAARSSDEFEALRLHVQTVVEGYEAAHEELQSANEEILSSNEELQSTNEELQTSKEEVDAANEELSTVNDELQARIAELARLNDDLANVLTSAQIPIVILTKDLRIRSFTPAAAPFFNLIEADVGRPLSDMNVNLSVPELSSLLRNVLSTCGVTTIEVQERAGRWYTLRVRPYRTHDDEIDGLVLVLVDIDELKRAAQQIAHARDYAEAIVQTVHRPLVVLDSELRLHTANPEFYRTFAVSKEESEGRLVYELGNRQWNIPELRDRLQAVLAGGPDVNHFEVEHAFPWIGWRSMLIHARRVASKEGATDLILVAIDDITERRQRDRAFEKRDEDLVLADTRKNEFLAMLAHELRTPLAPIVHAGALLRQARDIDSTSIDRAAEVIVRQASHMARLIDDLLDVARITHNKVELRKQRSDLRVLIERAVEAARPLMDSRRHELLVTLPPAPIEIDADPARIEQVIGNLLSNAARYTEPGGRIELMAQQEAGVVILRVEDNGIGISADVLPGVFDLFAQADKGHERKTGGLGIGLTVVRSLVDMHGGSVEACSDGLGHGSAFVVRLPALQDDAGARLLANFHGAGRSARPRRVLIVEDNQDAAEALGSLLEAWGHDVRIVSDGPSALEAAATLTFDVILLDIGLPGANGYEVARALRQLPGLETTRIVALTGYGQGEDRRRSREAGFDEHLVKPVTAESLEGFFV